MKTTSRYYLCLFMMLVMFSCDKRKWENPVDPEVQGAALKPVLPFDHSVVDNDSIIFKWELAERCTSYELQIDDDNDFSHSELIKSDLDTNTYLIASDSLDIGSYYWRVRAKYGEDGWKNWSNIWTFTFSITEWSRTFGGSDDDYGVCVEELSDKGYIIAGNTESFGSDALVIKLDRFGNELWNHVYPVKNSWGWVGSIKENSDGGFIIAGEVSPIGIDPEAYLIRIDRDGNELWNRTYGGSRWESALCASQTSDGGFIFIGYTDSYGSGSQDVWLVKTDASGNKRWDRTFGGGATDDAFYVCETPDKGYVVVGRTESYGSGDYDIWILKTDSFGNLIWNRTFGTARYDIAHSAFLTLDGNIIIVGEKYSNDTDDFHVWLLKVDATGNELVSKTYGKDDNYLGNSVDATLDGNLLIIGEETSFRGGIGDLWIMKTNAFGDELWTRTFGGSGYDSGKSIKVTSDGGYIMIGNTTSYGAGGSDIWVIKVK